MDVDPEIQRILSECPEVELSEFSPDPKAGGNGDGPAPFHPAPVPVVAHDVVPVRPDAGPPDIVAPPQDEEDRVHRRDDRGAPLLRPEAPSAADTEVAEDRPSAYTPSWGPEILVDMAEAGMELHMAPTSVRRLIYQGKLRPAYKVGGKLVIRLGDLLDYLEQCQVQPKAWAMQPGESRKEGLDRMGGSRQRLGIGSPAKCGPPPEGASPRSQADTLRPRSGNKIE